MDLTRHNYKQYLVTLWAILTKYPFDSMQIMRGLFTVMWGAWLFNPYIKIEMTTPRYFSSIVDGVPHSVVGMYFMLVGLYLTGSVLIESNKHRALSFLAAMSGWTFLTLMYIFDSPTDVAIVNYGFLALESAWGLSRLKLS